MFSYGQRGRLAIKSHSSESLLLLKSAPSKASFHAPVEPRKIILKLDALNLFSSHINSVLYSLIFLILHNEN